MNNPGTRQQWIFDLLKNEPTLAYGDVFPKYSQKYSKSRRTFTKDWNKAQKRLKDYQQTINNEKLKESISIEKKALKKGLKTKIDRLMTLQKLVEDCEKDLVEGMTNDTYFKKGSPTEYRRKMSNTEYNQTRRTLRELQSEISKIEGDYIAKVDITSKGEKINTGFKIEIIDSRSQVKNNGSNTDNTDI